MLSVSWGEILLVLISGLVILGPKDVIQAYKSIRATLRQFKQTAADVHASMGLDETIDLIEGDDGKLYPSYSRDD